jgi:hypothetical protein
LRRRLEVDEALMLGSHGAGFSILMDLHDPHGSACIFMLAKSDRQKGTVDPRREPRIDGLCALISVVRGSGAATATRESGKAEQRESTRSWDSAQSFKVDDASPVVGFCTAGIAIIETDGPRTGATEAE